MSRTSNRGRSDILFSLQRSDNRIIHGPDVSELPVLLIYTNYFMDPAELAVQRREFETIHDHAELVDYYKDHLIKIDWRRRRF